LGAYYNPYAPDIARALERGQGRQGYWTNSGVLHRFTRKPPKLGTFAHFLQTVIHSQQRRQSSPLIASFLGLAAEWTGSHWLRNPAGLPRALGELTSDFRNRAAHIDELGKEDYVSCRELVVGERGILWNLVVSTEWHKR
jgi:hypothetical protein